MIQDQQTIAKFYVRFSLTLLAVVTFANSAQSSSKEAHPPAKIKIAFIHGATGPDPNTARELERGLDAFLAQTPEALKYLQIDRYDNKGDVLETARLVDKITQENTHFIVGIARSDEALAAAKSASAHHALFITPFATHPGVGLQGPDIFQVCFSDTFQGAALAELTLDILKPKKMLLLINTESIYSSGLATQFQSSLASGAHHGKKAPELKILNYTEHEMNLENVLSVVKSFQPDAVMIPDHITRAALIAKSIRGVNSKVKFLGGDGFGGKKILTGIFGDTPDIELYYTTHWHQNLKTPINQTFVSAYAKLPGAEDPTSGAALTFDAFKILWTTLKAVHFKNDSALVSSKMRKTVFEVTTGQLKLPKSPGESTKKAAVVIHVLNGEYNVFKAIEPTHSNPL